MEMFPIYDRRSFWTDHSLDGNRQYKHERRGTADLLTVLDCGNGRVLSHPMSERFPDLAEVECRAVSPGRASSEKPLLKVRREDDTELTDASVAPLSWMRHLKYLLMMHHIQAWNMHTRVSEINDQLIELDPESVDLWNQLKQSIYPQLKLRPTFIALDEHEENLKSGLVNDIQTRKKAETEIRTLLERGSAYIQQEIDILTQALDTYRAYIFRTQHLLREAEMSSIDVPLSFYGSVIPLVLALTLLTIRLHIKQPPPLDRYSHCYLKCLQKYTDSITCFSTCVCTR